MFGTVAVAAVLLGAGGCGRGPFWKFPALQVERCSAVDFLFVIDNSESMEAHQQNLRASFDPFITGIRDSLDDVDDFHVGVVTTDAYRYNTPEQCRGLGALVTSTKVPGPGREIQECGPFVEGNRYMTEQDDLTEAFNCTAAVGTEGRRDEEPMDAMRKAIAGNTAWYDECNGDFIRDDALLVSVIITDEADGEWVPGDREEPPEPSDWYGSVVSAKGTESNAVIVSLLNGVTPQCPTTDPAFDGTNIAEFTHMFSHGFVGGICEQDYGAIFSRAVDEIDDACTSFTADLGPRP